MVIHDVNHKCVSETSMTSMAVMVCMISMVCMRMEGLSQINPKGRKPEGFIWFNPTSEVFI